MTYNENSGRMSYRDVSDDMNYYRRESTKCSSLSVDQAKKSKFMMHKLSQTPFLSLTPCFQVPGWAKLEQYAKDTWGDGGWNIVTNPPEVRSLIIQNYAYCFLILTHSCLQYTDRWADSCVDDAPVKIEPIGQYYYY